jgi:ABC-type lipoprotein release transport system permease subunit
LQEIQ